jgi:hypothetical protein
MKNGNEFLAEVEPVREELAAWRGNPEKARTIPDAIWDKATVLAKKYGVHAVSNVLKMSHGDLKRHVTGGTGRQHLETGLMPAFIEVKPESASEELGCVIELTKGSGTRMRISLKSAGSVDWCRIKEAFLGA